MTDLDRAELRRLEQRYQDGFGDISVLVRGMRAEVDRVKRLAGRASERVALQRRAEAAEATIERVRALHFQYRGVGDHDICAEPSCSTQGDGHPMLWPCPTVAALAPVTEEGDEE